MRLSWPGCACPAWEHRALRSHRENCSAMLGFKTGNPQPTVGTVSRWRDSRQPRMPAFAARSLFQLQGVVLGDHFLSCAVLAAGECSRIAPRFWAWAPGRQPTRTAPRASLLHAWCFAGTGYAGLYECKHLTVPMHW